MLFSNRAMLSEIEFIQAVTSGFTYLVSVSLIVKIVIQVSIYWQTSYATGMIIWSYLFLSDFHFDPNDQRDCVIYGVQS